MLPPAQDSLKIASSTSSSASRLMLKTNAGSVVYVVEEIKRRSDHIHASFKTRGYTYPSIVPVPAS